MEVFDFAYYVDAGYKASGTATDTWATPAHLEDLEVRVLGDQAPMVNRTPNGGTMTLEFPVSAIEIGLNFQPRVKLMPPVIMAPGQEMQMGRSRFKRVRVNVRSTKGLYVNDYPMPERYLDVDPLDTAPGALTGMFEIPLAGWGELQGVEFTQPDPLPMTILAVEQEVEMH
jgi:hypothetical protein